MTAGTFPTGTTRWAEVDLERDWEAEGLDPIVVPARSCRDRAEIVPRSCRDRVVDVVSRRG
jgi:hypothetical protein